MKGITQAGPTEIAAVKRRAIRDLAMERISQEDCDYLTEHCDLIAVRMEQMHETERKEQSGQA